MTTVTPTADALLTQRCRAILIERAKNKQDPIMCDHMARLLREEPSACFRAMHAIEGVIVERPDGGKSYAKFSVGAQ